MIFNTIFWDDITIFWYENLLSFLTEEKLFWTNKKFADAFHCVLSNKADVTYNFELKYIKVEKI